MKLTIKNLLEGQLESVAGCGFYGHECRDVVTFRNSPNPYLALENLDNRIIECANNLKWNAKQLHTFMDSRDGRHLGDTIIDLVYTGGMGRQNLMPKIETAMKAAEGWMAKEVL